MQRSIATCVLALFLTACGSDDNGGNGEARTPGLAPRTDATVDIDSQNLRPAAGPLPERPPTLRDTIMIAGQREIVDLALVRSPEGFAVPFSTYVPASLTAEMGTEGPADLATFSVGEVGDAGDAFMVMGIYEAGTTRLLVEDRVRMVVVSRGPGMDVSEAVEPPSWGEWAVEISYPRSLDTWYAGSAVIGQHGPRFFHMIELYPAEYGDAISPLFDVVLEHWRWGDNGMMLEAGGTVTR